MPDPDLKALVYIEAQDGVINPDSLGVLSKAAGLTKDVSAILCGDKVAPLAAEAVRHGARRVLVVDQPVLADPLAAPRIDILAQACSRYDIDALFWSSSSPRPG